MQRVPNELLDILIGLFDETPAIKYVAEQAGLPMGLVSLNGPVKVVWFNVLKEAIKHEMIPAIIDVVSSEYPNLKWDSIRQVIDRAGTPGPPNVPDLDDWRGRLTEQELEKITGSQPTFLPLHFFELGRMRARAVVLIQLPSGSGTGFLTHSNLLLTNNHVICSFEKAESAIIRFNFQQELDGSSTAVSDFKLAPQDGFATSTSHDWTAVRVKGDANSEWGVIPLTECRVNDGEFVNIIQHPMGGPKVVALYHNVVVYSDDDRIQYLTDTLPGSSGSPVFRSDWSLVGIHHAGRSAKLGTSGNATIRNEGITINRLIQDLREKGFM